jgi:hypothetical protein
MKPRSDSTLKTLPAERQDAIAEYLSAHSLLETVAWLKADGIKTSRSALSEFGSWYALRQQLNQNQSTVETLLEELKRGNPGMTPEQLEQAGQLFFTTLAIEQRDSLTWSRVQKDKRASVRDALEERRIKLLEKKADAYDRAQAAISDAKKSKGGITPETLTRIEQELRLL